MSPCCKRPGPWLGLFFMALISRACCVFWRSWLTSLRKHNDTARPTITQSWVSRFVLVEHAFDYILSTILAHIVLCSMGGRWPTAERFKHIWKWFHSCSVILSYIYNCCSIIHFEYVQVVTSLFLAWHIYLSCISFGPGRLQQGLIKYFMVDEAHPRKCNMHVLEALVSSSRISVIMASDWHNFDVCHHSLYYIFDH